MYFSTVDHATRSLAPHGQTLAEARHDARLTQRPPTPSPVIDVDHYALSLPPQSRAGSPVGGHHSQMLRLPVRFEQQNTSVSADAPVPQPFGSMGPLRRDTGALFSMSSPRDALNAAFQSAFQEAMGSRYHPRWQARLLDAGDDQRGFLDLVGDLSGDPVSTEEEFSCIAEQRLLHQHYTLVVLEDARIIATGSLFAELKFSHHGSLAGHIEDVVVDPAYRSKRASHGPQPAGSSGTNPPSSFGLGLSVVKTLMDFGERGLGCYKTILDCTPENVGFYERAGLSPKEIMMSHKPTAVQEAAAKP